MRITISNSIQYNKYYISVQYDTHKGQELRKISVGGLLVDQIPKIFQTNIIPILWWTVMRITIEILGVQGWTLTTSPANCVQKLSAHLTFPTILPDLKSSFFFACSFSNFSFFSFNWKKGMKCHIQVRFFHS